MRRDLEQFIDATLRGTAQAPRDSTIVTTRHRIMLGGRPLEYTARAGVLPIIDNNDATVRARVFFVAYTVARAPGAPPRPITFAWNGGPGANSLLLHLEAMGPRRLSDDGKTAVLGDNDLTWLDQTDLVFIDPVGTGYSRATRPEFEQEFYGVLGDVAATREFIRVYRTRFDAWEQPVYVAGESYGTWRAAGVADAMERFEEPVAGVILISGGIPVGEIISDPWRAATFLSARTLTAHHHKALPPELQPLSRDSAVAVVERWARLVYAPALARRDSLTPAERQEIVQRLSMYTGLALAQVDTQTLLVDRQYFIDNLLIARGAGGRLGRFDTRVVSGAPGSSTSGDSALTAQRRAVTLKYLREELGYATELPYYGLQGAAPNGPAQRWQYDQGPPGQRVVARNSDGPPGGRPSWIRSAMALNPRMRVFVATGNFDSLNSCSNMRYMVGLLREDERPNFTLGCYDGGHMMYEDRPARAQLKRDITGFYRRR
jgi:carboxypeptidase C (cathepsin A)